MFSRIGLLLLVVIGLLGLGLLALAFILLLTRKRG